MGRLQKQKSAKHKASARINTHVAGKRAAIDIDADARCGRVRTEAPYLLYCPDNYNSKNTRMSIENIEKFLLADFPGGAYTENNREIAVFL